MGCLLPAPRRCREALAGRKDLTPLRRSPGPWAALGCGEDRVSQALLEFLGNFRNLRGLSQAHKNCFLFLLTLLTSLDGFK